jgi:hypothetical protein
VRDDAVALGLVGNKPFNAPLLQGASASVDGLDVTVVAPDTPALDKLASRWKKAKKKKDPSVITASYTDGSIPNLSSIVLLVRQGGRSALLTGDARGDRVLAGLRASSLLDPEPVHVRLLKLPHHGSERNVTPDFFQSITADHYVVSADGIKHHHPHEDTLRSLVESRAVRDEYVVHLTNPVPFALNVLHELHVGRRFSVNVRAETDSGVVIEL